MEELTAEVRALSLRVKVLTIIATFIVLTFIGQIVGIYTAAGRAGPRLVDMRKRSDALAVENNRLRAELEALRKSSAH